MKSTIYDCNSAKKIRVIFDWSNFEKQRSGGLINGVLNSRNNEQLDCDATAVVCGENGNVLSPKINECCVYYGNEELLDGIIKHHGDNMLQNENKEEIDINLLDLPAEVSKVHFFIDLFKEKRISGFGKVNVQFLRVIDAETGEELFSEIINEHVQSKAVRLGTLYRQGGKGWYFNCSAKEMKEATKREDFYADLLG